MSNVVEHQTAIWKRAEAANERITKREGEVIAAWRDLGDCLNTLRSQYAGDAAFSEAKRAHGIDRTNEHCKAAMWLATLDDDQLSTLRETFPTALHPATLQNRCREAFPAWLAQTRDAGLHSVQTADPTPLSPPAEAPVVPETPETAPLEIVEQPVTQQVDQKPAPLDRRMVLVKKLREKTKLSDADVRGMVDHYTHNITRQMLAKLHQDELTALAEIIRTGRLGAKNDSNMNKFSARALVPELPKEWTRNRTVEPTERKTVKAILADVDRFITMRDAGCRTKAACDRWWADNVTRRKAIDVTTAATTQANGSGDTAPIIVHGRTIWPRPSYVSDADKYTRSAAVAMFHLWHDLDQELARAEPSPVGRGRFILKIAMWIKQGISPHAGAMLQEMATAMQSDEPGSLETSHLTFITGDQL